MTRKHKPSSALRLAVIAFSITAAVATYSQAAAQGGKDPGQISGYAFGDIYSANKHHNSAIQGMNGFWFRRIYLTYDKKMDAGFAARFRLEANSPGDFTSSTTMQPFIKDMYLQRSQGDQKFYLGLIPTPTWDNIDSTLAYRHIEKSPLDLFKMGEARDQGISVKGPLDKEKKTTYWLMVGNGSGTKGKTEKGNAIYFQLAHKLTKDLTIEGYVDRWDKTGHTDWRTAYLNLMYVTPQSKAGLLFADQRRQNATGPDTKLQVTSLYVDTKVSDNARPFFRVDFVNNPVPGADKISYLALSKDAKPTFYMAGLEYKLSEDVKIIPNIEYVTYRDSTTSSTPKNNVFFRVTFFFAFK
ncbi:MAG: hypothetical protein HZC36_13030 [Armatimonadetes bacterium]|nr:hypothetical protein [Armatimonadota bacterium]